MLIEEVESLIEQIIRWAVDEQSIQAVALVGSWARGMARDDSDVDLVILTEKPEVYLINDQWTSKFGEVEKITYEDWGAVQSKRVFYKGGLQVEYGVTTTKWAEARPVDPGTGEMVRDGMRILYDKNGVLGALVEALDPGREG